MIVNEDKELKALEKIGRICALTREEMLKQVKPGITTKELDKIGERVLNEYGAKSAPKYSYNFPGATCISVNNEVAHGIPSSRILRQGDLVNIDVSACLDGYFADTGATVLLNSNSPLKKKVCECSRIALMKGINQAVAGTMINQIGKAIFEEAKNNGFTVIRNLTGHGIGKKIHEEPRVLNYFDIWDTHILEAGLVLAIETFISSKDEFIIEDRNGWTLITPNNSVVAQYEHTIVVMDKEPIILTL